MNGDDIIFSLGSMGFDNYSDVLAIYLEKYRESLKDGKGSDKRPSSGMGGEDDDDDDD